MDESSSLSQLRLGHGRLRTRQQPLPAPLLPCFSCTQLCQQARIQAPSTPSRSHPRQLPIPISLTPFLALSHEALHSRNTPDEDSCSISPIAGSVRASTASPGARPSPKLPGSSAPGHHLFPFLSLPSGSLASPLAAFSRPSPALFSSAPCFPRPRMASSVARLSVLLGHPDSDFPDSEPNSTSSISAKLLQALPDSSTRSPSLSCHLFSLLPSPISHPTQNAWREARIVRAWEQLPASSHLPHTLSSTFSLSLCLASSQAPPSTAPQAPRSQQESSIFSRLPPQHSAQHSAFSPVRPLGLEPARRRPLTRRRPLLSLGVSLLPLGVGLFSHSNRHRTPRSLLSSALVFPPRPQHSAELPSATTFFACDWPRPRTCSPWPRLRLPAAQLFSCKLPPALALGRAPSATITCSLSA